MEIKNCYPLQSVIENFQDNRLEFILMKISMCHQMGGKQGNMIKQSSKDTAVAVYHTCKDFALDALQLFLKRKNLRSCVNVLELHTS